MESLYRAVNNILYCKRWKETLSFYRLLLQAPGNRLSDWFVEFHITKTARISIADESRANIKSAGGKGITLSLQVEDVNQAWIKMKACNLDPGQIVNHPWGARVFYLYDPEGSRIEIWEPS